MAPVEGKGTLLDMGSSNISEYTYVYLVENIRSDIVWRAVYTNRSIEEGPQIPSVNVRLSNKARLALRERYNSRSRDGHAIVRLELDHSADPTLVILSPHAQFFEYITLDGRRIMSISQSQRESTAGSSIVLVPWNGSNHVGVVNSIFRHNQTPIHDSSLLAEINWLGATRHGLFAGEVDLFLDL